MMDDIVNNEVAESTAAHQQDILIAHKGWFKFAPNVGVGIDGYIDDEARTTDMVYAVRENFSADGMRVDSVVFLAEKIQVDAIYTG